MSGMMVTKRYALALYEVAESADKLDEVRKDIQFIASLMKEQQIRDFCRRTSSTPESRTEFMKIAILPYISSELTANFIKTVVKNSREDLLPLLPEAFREISDKKNGIVTVQADFAAEPDPGIVEKIKNKMHKRLGCEVRISTAVRPEIIKGFRIIWQNMLVDCSIAGRVRQMRQILRSKY